MTKKILLLSNPVIDTQEKKLSAKTYSGIISLCAILLFAVNITYGQNIYPGSTLAQDFDAIGGSATATLPASWKVSSNNSVRTLDTYSSATTLTTQVAGNSMSAAAPGGIYNFGAGPAATAADRAIGGLSDAGSFKSVNLYIDIFNVNFPIENFSISYDIEKYKMGTNPAGFRVQMYYSNDGNTWTSAGTDFLTIFAPDTSNAGYTATPGQTISVYPRALKQSLAPSSHLYLAWNISVTSGTITDNAQGLAIDNIRISANFLGGTTYLVTNTNDAGPGSLRQALQDIQVTPGSDTVVFAPGVTGTIYLSTYLPPLRRGTNIIGPGADLLTIDGSSSPYYIGAMYIDSSSVPTLISGLTFANYNHTAVLIDGELNWPIVYISDCKFINCNGSCAVLAQFNRALTITNCSFYNNSSSAASYYRGGAIWSRNSSLAGLVSLTITGSTFSNNSAADNGGAVFCDKGVTINNSTFTGNSALNGGAIYCSANGSSITNSTISGNTAAIYGGGIYGGNSNIRIGNSIFAGNTAGNTLPAGPDISSVVLSDGHNFIGKDDGAVGFANGVNSDQVGSIATPINPLLAALANNGGTTETMALQPGSPCINAGLTYELTDQRGTLRAQGPGVDIGAYELECPTITPSITGSLAFCAGSSTILDAGVFTSYNWSTGATTQTISVNSAATFTVTVSNANGCTGSASVSSTVSANPTPTISGATPFCAGGSTTLDAGAGFTSYLWSTTETTQTISVNSAGTFTVTVTDGNGCSGSTSVTTTVTPSPVVNQPANQTLCNNTATAAVNFTGTAGATFSWTNDNPSIGIAASGTGDIASFTATNSGNAPVTATITVTPSIASFAYIGNFSSGNVSVINTTTNMVTATIPVGNLPSYGVSVSPDGMKVYVANIYGYVSVINTTTNTVIATIPVAPELYGLAVSPDGTKLYVVSIFTIYVINTSTNAVISSFNLGFAHENRGVSVSPDGTKMYITGSGAHVVSVINTSTNTVIANIPVGSYPSYPVGLSVTPDGTKVYVAIGGTNNVSVINTATNTVIATIAVGSNPFGVSVSPDGMKVYVTNRNSNNVSVINTTTNTVIATIPVGSDPFGVSVSPDGTKVYVANRSSNNVSVINTATNTIVTNVTVDSNPQSLGNFITGAACPATPKTFTITVNPNLTPSISGTLSFCSGSSTTLDAGAGYASYMWSTTATTQTISVNTAGTFTVTVTDANGCTGSDSITTTVLPSPSPTITGNTGLCSGDSTLLDACAGYNSYEWTTGATTQTIYAYFPGDYTVTVTDANGCTGTASVTVTQHAGAELFCTGSTLNCFGDNNGTASVAVFGSSTYSYLWNTNATSSSISGLTAGTYTVTVTSAFGCTFTCSSVVDQPAQLSVTETHVNATCGLPDGSIDISVTGGTLGNSGYSYLWNDANTNEDRSSLGAGTYTVTVTDGNGCTATTSVTLTSTGSAVCSITGSDFCSNSATQLCAATNSSYLWSTGSTTQCITVSTGGTYTVSVTDANGCTGSCSKTVITYAPPACSISGGNFCIGTSTQLCVNPVPGFPVNTYLWSTGVTTQCITVTTGGTYTVTVTNGNGCTSSCSTTVIEYPKPSCSVSGNDFCSGSSTQLCVSVVPGPSGNTYLWSTGSTTQCITVSTGGTYTVTVTDGNGCTGSCSITVNEFNLPTCSMTGSNFCQGGSSQLCAATNSSYLWSTGSTTQCIIVSTGGTYTVTVANADGCTSSCSKTVTAFTLPTCSITGSNFCQGGSSQLCAATNSSYLWSTGSTTQCITVSTGGTYTVTVANADGCTSSCSKTATAFTLPTCSITGSNFCQGGSSQLCAATNSSYLWSTGSTTQCIIVSTGGTYTVTVANSNGCTSSCSKTVTAFTLPTCSITGGNFCQGGSSQLCAATNSSYLWSTGSTTQCIIVSTGGTYTVTVSNANGCTSSCSKTVTAFTLPTCSITGSNFCQGGSSQLCAATNSSYLWSTGSTTQCIIVSTGGTYTVTVANADGCTSSCSKTVTAFTLPICSITGSNFCQGGSSQLCAATNSSYLWSTGSTTQCIIVSTGGTYTVTVSNANGCTSSCSKTVTAFTLPTCSITGSNFCQGGSSQLCAATNSSYLWSTGSTTQCIIVSTGGTYTVTVANSTGCTSSCSKTVTAFTLPTCSITGSNFCQGGSSQLCAATNSGYLWSTGATTQCIIVSTGGTYTVTVTNADGCTSSCSKTVVAYALPVCAISGNIAYCQGSTTQLCGPTGMSSYLWSTGATTQCIAAAGGDYTVTVTNANGCTSSCSVTTNLRLTPVCAITGNNFCSGSSSQLCATAAPTGYVFSYAWSTGATTQCITITTGGTYSVNITNQYGCSSSCSKSILVYPTPVCGISGNIAYCQGSTTQLCASSGPYSYNWSTGATTQCIAAAGGDYTVTVTNADGCTSSCSVTTNLRLPPVCSITGNNFCSGSSSQLCAAAAPVGYVYSYLWSTGATTQCITVSTGGAYTVNITNQYGCTSSCSKTLTAYALPTCSITGSSSICQGTSTQLCAATNSSYLWNTGATTQCITVTTGGTYRVTVTNANGCTSSCSKVITVKALPNCSITGNSSVCEGSSAQWCAPGGLAAYLWSDGKTTKCISVNIAGTYTITVTNTNGCTSSCSKALTVNPLPATFTITGKGSICQGSSTQLCAPAGYSSYIWSTAKTTQCVTENSAATYTVTVTNSNGCTRKQSKKLTVNPLPVCSITGNTVIKSGTTTNLCVAIVSGNTYHWNTGAVSNCITVGAAGNYTVTVTNNKGCTSSCSIHVTVETARDGIDDGSANVAGNIEAKAFPNPFHSSTTIEFKNNKSDAHLTVEIFNMTGEKISVLFDGELSAGEVHQVKFDAANLGDGVYFYRITSGEAVLNGRVVLIRE